MDFKKTGIIKFLMSVAQKLKGKWLYAICSSLILGFLVLVLEDVLNLYALLAMPLLGFVLVGQIDFMRKLVTGERFNLEDMFKQYKLFVPAALTVALFTSLISVGLVLLVIPGIVMLLMYTFALHILEENKNMGSLEALDASNKLVKGYKIKLAMLYIAFIFILALAFGVGLGISFIANLIWATGLWVYAAIIAGILSVVFVYPFWVASLTVFYDELKLDKIKINKQQAELDAINIEEDDIEGIE